jgi:uncharacterized repeat protein (TIGR02543 family)
MKKTTARMFALALVLLAVSGIGAGVRRMGQNPIEGMETVDLGNGVVALRIGPGLPPPEYEQIRRARKPLDLPALKRTAGVKILDVPAFKWIYGCVPSATGMLIGYYDRNGYPDMYTDEKANGVCPMTSEVWRISGLGSQSPFVASEEHKYDFWDSTDTVKDPFYDEGTQAEKWTPHWDPLNGITGGNCLADFIGSNQYWIWGYRNPGDSPYYLGNSDGSSMIHISVTDKTTPHKSELFGDLTYGVVQFARWRGYEVDDWYNRTTDRTGYEETGFAYDEFCAEIDAGRPVLITLAGHEIIGIGYNRNAGTVYIHDTWVYTVVEIGWNEKYSGFQWGAISVIRLAPSPDVTFPVTVGTADSGKGITYPDGLVLVENGQKITAVPLEGYRFTGWTASGSVSLADPTKETTTMTVTGEGSAEASFVRTTCTVTFVAGPRGSIDGEFVQTVGYGENCTTVTAVPDDHCTFAGWTGDHEYEHASLTLTNVTDDMTITANFDGITHRVEFKVSGPGSLEGNTSQDVYWSHSTTAVKAVPDPGCVFTGWTGDASGTTNPLTVTAVAADMTITANFEAVYHALTFTAEKGGSLSGKTSQSVMQGFDASPVTAVPDQYYRFVGWTGGETGTTNPLTVKNVTKAMTVQATFEIDPAQIEVRPMQVPKFSYSTKGGPGRLRVTFTGIDDPATLGTDMTVLLDDETACVLPADAWNTKGKFVSENVKASWKAGTLVVSCKATGTGLIDASEGQIGIALSAPPVRWESVRKVVETYRLASKSGAKNGDLSANSFTYSWRNGVLSLKASGTVRLVEAYGKTVEGGLPNLLCVFREKSETTKGRTLLEERNRLFLSYKKASSDPAFYPYTMALRKTVAGNPLSGSGSVSLVIDGKSVEAGSERAVQTLR